MNIAVRRYFEDIDSCKSFYFNADPEDTIEQLKFKIFDAYKKNILEFCNQETDRESLHILLNQEPILKVKELDRNFEVNLHINNLTYQQIFANISNFMVLKNEYEEG